MKTLFIVITLFILPFSEQTTPAAGYYLICTGKYSKSYHKDYKSPNQYCRGLKACKAEIKRLPADQAKTKRSDPCDFCFGR